MCILGVSGRPVAQRMVSSSGKAECIFHGLYTGGSGLSSQSGEISFGTSTVPGVPRSNPDTVHAKVVLLRHVQNRKMYFVSDRFVILIISFQIDLFWD